MNITADITRLNDAAGESSLGNLIADSQLARDRSRRPLAAPSSP